MIAINFYFSFKSEKNKKLLEKLEKLREEYGDLLKVSEGLGCFVVSTKSLRIAKEIIEFIEKELKQQ